MNVNEIDLNKQYLFVLFFFLILRKTKNLIDKDRSLLWESYQDWFWIETIIDKNNRAILIKLWACKTNAFKLLDNLARVMKTNMKNFKINPKIIEHRTNILVNSQIRITTQIEEINHSKI
jgi:hypothetical protein